MVFSLMNGPMKIKTKENMELTVSVKWLNHEPEGIISFRYSNGMLCTSYYLSAFQGLALKDHELLYGGLPLDSAVSTHLERQTLSANGVKSCQRFIETCISLRR